LIIKKVNTEEEFQSCINYLDTKKVFPLEGTVLYYCEDTDGSIRGVAGWNRDTGATIDPFVTESAIRSIELYKFMEGLILGMGYGHIQVFVKDNEHLTDKLKRTEGYREVNKDTVSLIKKL